MTQPPPPAAWYPDPADSQVQRWWDGNQWTEHTRGGQAPPPPEQPEQKRGLFDRAFGDEQDTEKLRSQAQQATGGTAPPRGGGTLFTEPVLVVNQKAKITELTNEYQVYDQNGAELGSVSQVGQSTFRKVLRFVSNSDQFFTVNLEVRDVAHNPVLLLTRPRKIFKSKVQVSRPDGTEVGEITQENVFGKIRFSFLVGGQQIGGIQAENWRAWNFAVTDHTETEVARITKQWGGLLKAAFTTADNYVVQIHRPLTDPLASMVVASALTVDTALKQDDND